MTDEQAKKPYEYDLTEVYEREIKPKIDALYEACQEHNMPLVVAAQVKFEEDGSGETHHTTSTSVLLNKPDKAPILCSPHLVAAAHVADRDNLEAGNPVFLQIYLPAVAFASSLLEAMKAEYYGSPDDEKE